jgi:two-component system cell cycle response regulator DivK
MTQLVLVVDDNEQNRKLARDVLGAAGFRTLEAGSAAEGISLASEHRPDVILMDVRLPDLDGAEAARELKQDARTAGIPIVALTALRATDREWLLESCFDGFLEKPIAVREFPDQVRDVIARAGASRPTGGQAP